MSHIISLDFDQNIPYYICIHEDGSYDESYSPKNATQFKTVDEAINWSQNNTTLAEYTKVVNYESAKTKFDQWISQGMIRRSFPAINRNLSRKYDPEKDDKYSVLNWKIEQTQNDSKILYRDYKSWPDLYSVFDHLWSVDKYIDGTISFHVCVKKNSNFQKFKEELNLILDKVTYREDEEIVLSIFDHYCGEGGNVSFLVQHNDGTWSVRGRFGYHLKNKSLEKCFDYIKEFRFYE